MGEVRITNENGHYVAYVDGEFFASGDTQLELIVELEKAGYL